ncbi:MAG: SDR family oxidoreductase [Okeania sp. SIO2G4]|uniref:SDR family oxidoreductase n=1 Tax=unclassified Okeania TaxID=2634635 RepID=UPI0013BC9CF0|nr:MULTISPECIES: SDR family oxidoreductase [unclassified Okeania]NEP70397.1 SDR family oxidoreductase [Okeania sp. SIO2G5]NEP91631.1 SDR family oxidoreductase [Okeania sp. SIO2F5]NEQ92804.1 SDR family oxidoreductase [Okeania sp. SIO2G4]
MATYLITGTNRGIGQELCKQVHSKGDKVIAVCRQSNQELENLGVRLETGVDITSEKDVANLVNRLKGIKLDVLINNAGIVERNSLDDLDFDSIRKQFEVNAIGTLRLTHALLPLMESGSKIAIITSRMGSIDDNTSGGTYGYRMSKVAVSMAGKSLSVDLKPQGIAVAILHPGLISTRMTNFTGISPAEAAENLLARIDELNLENTGTFWHAKGEVLPW